MHVFHRFSNYQPSFSRDADTSGALAGLRGPRRLRITGGEGDSNALQASARSGPGRGAAAAPRTDFEGPRRLGGFPGRVGAADGETVTTRSRFSRTVEGDQGSFSFESDVFVRTSPNEYVSERSVRQTYTRSTAPAPAPVEDPVVELPPAPAAEAPVAEAPAPVSEAPTPVPVAEAPAPAPVAVPVAEADSGEEPAEAGPAETPLATVAAASATVVEAVEVEVAPVEAAPVVQDVEPAPVENAPAPVESTAVEAPEPPPVEAAPVQAEEPAFARSTRRQTSFEVVTLEGDKVSINLGSDRRVEHYRSPTESRTSRVFERSVNIEVDGNLSASELNDIQKLTGGFDFSNLGSLASYRYSSTVTHEVSRSTRSISA